MAQMWEVVGGTDKGGILVRSGVELTSPQESERLSTGASIEELALQGDRLNYKLATGTGPQVGWISIKLKDKDLAVRCSKDASAPAGEADNGIDTALKQRMVKAAQDAGKDLALWAMKYPSFYKFPLPAGECKFRVFCFHNAGSAESVWTTPVKSDWNTWIKGSKAVEIVAVSYPGRDKMAKEKPFTSIDKLNEAMLPVLYDKLTDGVPYAVLAHSVGTWVCFDLLSKLRKIGVSMPQVGFFNGFPGPQLPLDQRPWRRQRDMNEAQFKEEVLKWDPDHFGGAAKMVFDEPGWTETWQPLMRADFQLFDEYELPDKEIVPFNFPIYSSHFEKENMNKPEMVELWKEWTTAGHTFDIVKDAGHLTCVYLPELKNAYFAKILEVLKGVSGVP